MKEDRLYDKHELAAALGISVRTVEVWWRRHSDFLETHSVRRKHGRKCTRVSYTAEHVRAIAEEFGKDCTLPDERKDT